MPGVMLESCISGLYAVRFSVSHPSELTELDVLLSPLMERLDNLYRCADMPEPGFSTSINSALFEVARLMQMRDLDPNVEITDFNLTLRVSQTGFGMLVSHLGEAGVFLDLNTSPTQH